eukprot:526365_1
MMAEKIIANQTAELVQLQHKLARLEGIGKRFEQHKILLDDAIKQKNALQEIFFNTTILKRQLESENNCLNILLNENIKQIRECKEDNLLEFDSISNLHKLELSFVEKKHNKLVYEKECLIDTIKAKYLFKKEISSIKYDVLETKYKFTSSQNKQLLLQLKLFKKKLLLMQKNITIKSKYEEIIILLLSELTNYNNINNNINILYNEYNKLKQIINEQDDKIIGMYNKNNKLNTIIEQNEKQTSKMQQ